MLNGKYTMGTMQVRLLRRHGALCLRDIRYGAERGGAG